MFASPTKRALAIPGRPRDGARVTTFKQLGLPDHLLRSLRDLGFDAPTPIQVCAIPPIAAGDDVAGEAQTGSGKTAAFVLPILQRLCDSPAAGRPGVRVLTLAPTRELALQVATVFRRLAKHAPRPIHVVGVIGGENVEQQIAAVTRGADVIVATPGRLQDLLDRAVLDLSDLQVLVLDEADKLLDLGFSEALATLLESVPVERQTLVFSATLPQRVLDLSANVLRNPVSVRVDDAPVGPVTIHQRVIEVDQNSRRILLQHLVKTEKWGRTLVFVATKRASDNLSAKLCTAGVWAAPLHGGLQQSDRVAVLSRFKSGRVPVLIATDLAARGIDVPKLGAVVNFDLPRSPTDYLHRIGRTGRAGEAGVAVSFVDDTSAAHFRVIEKHCQVQLPRERVPGFEPANEFPGRSSLYGKGPPPLKGKRLSKKDKLRAQAAKAGAGQVEE
ncbi:MAG: ATP-dependent RNA helicase RhlE [Flavobacteriales bacterium]